MGRGIGRCDEESTYTVSEFILRQRSFVSEIGVVSNAIWHSPVAWLPLCGSDGTPEPFTNLGREDRVAIEQTSGEGCSTGVSDLVKFEALSFFHAVHQTVLTYCGDAK